jgi:N-acetylglucosamine kinase-like BadF-type ATPase
MIVVVDSGSTKADWQLTDATGTESLHTRGINPVFIDEVEIYDILAPVFADHRATHLASHIYFYGAGCWDEGRNRRVEVALNRIFPTAAVEVHHDLLGAARATCGTQPGISCIIGTGSNTCLYNGAAVTDNVTNLGYLIGDEGSGTWLGKELIRAYFYREMPGELRLLFEAQFPGGEENILNQIYAGEDTPNVYLGSFTRFISAHKQHIFIQHLLYQAFAVLIDRHVRKYPNHTVLPVHFIGSVAYIFQDILRVVLTERNMSAGVFIQKPIDELTAFHTRL